MPAPPGRPSWHRPERCCGVPAGAECCSRRRHSGRRRWHQHLRRCRPRRVLRRRCCTSPTGPPPHVPPSRDCSGRTSPPTRNTRMRELVNSSVGDVQGVGHHAGRAHVAVRVRELGHGGPAGHTDDTSTVDEFQSLTGDASFLGHVLSGLQTQRHIVEFLVRAGAAVCPANELVFFEIFEVAADGRLRDLERRGEVGDACVPWSVTIATISLSRRTRCTAPNVSTWVDQREVRLRASESVDRANEPARSRD